VDGDIVAYAWTQVGGTTAALSNPGSPNPGFTAPAITSGTVTLTYQLIVTDNDGADSNPDEVVVTVSPAVVNSPPIANSLVGSDLQVSLNVSNSDSITFNLTGSDPDGDSFTFELVSVNQVSGTTFTTGGNFTNDGGVTFEALDFFGTFSFTFKVIDEHGLSSNIATVNIVVFEQIP
jgi:hypothetical protein